MGNCGFSSKLQVLEISKYLLFNWILYSLCVYYLFILNCSTIEYQIQGEGILLLFTCVSYTR